MTDMSASPKLLNVPFGHFVEDCIRDSYQTLEISLAYLRETPYICNATRHHAIEEAYQIYFNETVCDPRQKAVSFKPA